MILPNKNELINNFSCCTSWEEKYIYLIELGEQLPVFPKKMKINNYLIPGCQSKVWIAIFFDENDIIKLYGDSDSAIVKGLIAVIFIFYQGSNKKEVNDININNYLFDVLSLKNNLSSFRAQGIQSIIQYIKNKIK